MSSPDNPGPANRGIGWLAIVRIVLVQILVLLALCVAVVRYLDWSSDATFAEFIAASEPSAQHLHPRPIASLQGEHGQKPCDRRP